MEAFLIIALVVGLVVVAMQLFKDQPAVPKQNDSTEQPNAPIRPEELHQQQYACRRGAEGEERIRRVLSRLPREEYTVLSDVLLPTNSGTTQIDHVVVSLYGIFIIEVKNFQGQIYGRKDSEEWKKYINGKEYPFLNPLLQNKTHVKAVARVTGTDTANIFPLTVFSGTAVLKIEDCEQVIYEYSLLQTIKMHNARVFTPEQAKYYARLIDDAIEENNETARAHLQYVKEVVSQKDREVSMGYCPRCNGILVRRKGKYGDFYGCSNYPDCKYTRKMQ